MSTMKWDEARACLRAGEKLIDSQGDTWSVRDGEIGYVAANGRWCAWVTWLAPTVTFTRPDPEMWGKATAWAWMRAHPGEQLIDDDGDAWYASHVGTIYFEGPGEGYRGCFTPASELAHVNRTWHAPKAAPAKPRVTRIDVTQRADGRWDAKFVASTAKPYQVFGYTRPPTVAEVSRNARLMMKPGEELDFSDAFTIVTPYTAPKPCARAWAEAFGDRLHRSDSPAVDFGKRVHEALERDFKQAEAKGYVQGYIDRALEPFKTPKRCGPSVVPGIDPGVAPGILWYSVIVTAPKPKPRVTRIDVAQRADRSWEWQFKASDGTCRWNSGAMLRPAVGDIARALPDFDFSDAFTIVTPYAKPKPRRHEWVYTVGDLYGMNYGVIAHRVLSEAL